MSEITVTKDNYEEEVQKSEIPVLLDFWSNRCGPCLRLLPILTEISEENDRIKICKINADEEEDLSDEFDVFGLPHLVIMKAGEPVDKSVGFMTKEEIERWLRSKLGGLIC